MGKRSRKRPATDRAAATRAERDARRAAATGAPRAAGRRATRERPPAPWGSFPLTELVVLVALILGVVGFIRLSTHSGKVMVGAAMVLGSLGGLEVSIREHFAGFKSHTTLLAASTAVLSMILISVVGGASGLAVLGIVVAVGLLVFVLAFWGFRQAFMRRSGGLGFR
jgi:hypothetical protein